MLSIVSELTVWNDLVRETPKTIRSFSMAIKRPFCGDHSTQQDWCLRGVAKGPKSDLLPLQFLRNDEITPLIVSLLQRKTCCTDQVLSSSPLYMWKLSTASGCWLEETVWCRPVVGSLGSRAERQQ